MQINLSEKLEIVFGEHILNLHDFEIILHFVLTFRTHWTCQEIALKIFAAFHTEQFHGFTESII